MTQVYEKTAKKCIDFVVCAQLTAALHPPYLTNNGGDSFWPVAVEPGRHRRHDIGTIVM
jgi:hypothetical protein